MVKVFSGHYSSSTHSPRPQPRPSAPFTFSQPRPKLLFRGRHVSKLLFHGPELSKLLFNSPVNRKHFFCFCIEELEEHKNKSPLPTRKQAYNENYKLTRIPNSDDPVKSLIAKQRADSLIITEIIRKIMFDDESFVVLLFTDCMINNTANFCCNNTDQFLSPFYMDFTFEIGHFFLLVSTFKNSTLLSKGSTCCPSLIGLVMFVIKGRKKRSKSSSTQF